MSTTVAVLSTLAGFVTARAVAYHRRRSALLFLAYLPFAVSPVILGVSLLYVYIRLALVATVAGVVLSHTIFAYGFAVVYWVPFWNPEKRAFEDLVRTLGGSTASPSWWARARSTPCPSASTPTCSRPTSATPPSPPACSWCRRSRCCG